MKHYAFQVGNGSSENQEFDFEAKCNLLFFCHAVLNAKF